MITRRLCGGSPPVGGSPAARVLGVKPSNGVWEVAPLASNALIKKLGMVQIRVTN